MHAMVIHNYGAKGRDFCDLSNVRGQSTIFAPSSYVTIHTFVCFY